MKKARTRGSLKQAEEKHDGNRPSPLKWPQNESERQLIFYAPRLYNKPTKKEQKRMKYQLTFNSGNSGHNGGNGCGFYGRRCFYNQTEYSAKRKEGKKEGMRFLTKGK